MLDELTARGITWLTLRQRGQTELARLAALPATAWKHATDRPIRPLPPPPPARRHDHPQGHRRDQVRQIAIRNIGRDEPTLLITNELTAPAKDLFARYAERMIIENELDAYISGFHLDALTSAVPLNVDLDTTLTVVAGNLYRLLARPCPATKPPPRTQIWRHFLDTGGTLHVTDHTVTCALNLRSHHPILIDAGFADLEIPIPWWNGRTLRFRFPPR